MDRKGRDPVVDLDVGVDPVVDPVVDLDAVVDVPRRRGQVRVGRRRGRRAYLAALRPALYPVTFAIHAMKSPGSVLAPWPWSQ